MTNSIPKAEDLFHELSFTTSRSGGPGGQNVNKVNSKVTLKWSIVNSALLKDEQRIILLKKLANQVTANGVLVLTDQSTRSQIQNKQSILEKLNALLKSALTPKKKRKPSKPTKSSKRKRLEGKRQQAEKKQWRKKI